MFTSSMYSCSNGGSGIGHEHPINCNPRTTTSKNNITPKALQAFASNSLIKETETNRHHLLLQHDTLYKATNI